MKSATCEWHSRYFVIAIVWHKTHAQSPLGPFDTLRIGTINYCVCMQGPKSVGDYIVDELTALTTSNLSNSPCKLHTCNAMIYPMRTTHSTRHYNKRPDIFAETFQTLPNVSFMPGAATATTYSIAARWLEPRACMQSRESRAALFTQHPTISDAFY